MASSNRPRHQKFRVNRFGFEDDSESECENELKSYLDDSDEESAASEGVCESCESSDDSDDERFHTDNARHAQKCLMIMIVSQWNFVDVVSDRRLHELPVFSRCVGLQVSIPENPWDRFRLFHN